VSVLRAVADTNVLVAAAISPRGTCGRLLDAALEKRWTLVASPQLIAEFGEVLFREKFRSWLPEDEASRFVADIRTLADVVADPPDAGAAVTADPKDEFLVALAQAADVAALISGDPHLTNLKNLDPPVLTPAAFLHQLSDKPDTSS
jgi:putative PIN family toxin of toxin-antitoxin system